MSQPTENVQQMTPAQQEVLAMYVTAAQVAHNVNRAYCASIGDTSQPEWNDAPEWQQQSAIDGVAFHFSNPTATPDQSHKNWMAQKVKEGWIYGKEKDVDTRRHPCMVPYDQLPQEQRSKDFLFKAVCEEFAKIFGMRETAM